jgi:hypothetical protein
MENDGAVVQSTFPNSPLYLSSDLQFSLLVLSELANESGLVHRMTHELAYTPTVSIKQI